MLRYLFLKLIGFLGKITRKRIIYFPEERARKVLTAVRSDAGFWYAGNVLDITDIAHGVLYNGSVESDGTKLVTSILKNLLAKKKSLAFFDIGANTGYFGVMAAFLGKGNITTYAFEPVKEFNDIERETLKLNNLQGVCEIFNVALGHAEATAKIFLAGTGSSLRKDFLGNRPAPSIKVSVVKLDNFAKAKNLKPPDFIKIDVEGHELAVLKGANQHIKNFLPVIWYESSLTIKANNFTNPDFFPIQDFLKNLGYKLFWCGPQLAPAPATGISDGTAMYLALHPNQHADLFSILGELYASS